MRPLTDLLLNKSDREYLQQRGVFTDIDQFSENLPNRPRCQTLSKFGESEKGRFIWAGQQLYCDYKHSVTEKVRCLNDLNRNADLTPFFVCADTDRAGSEKAMTTIYWPLKDTVGTLQVVKVKAARNTEPRFVESCVNKRQNAIRVLKEYLKQTLSEEQFELAQPQYQRLIPLFDTEEPTTLAKFNLELTRLLMNHLGYHVPTLLLSDFLADQAMTNSVNQWLNNREQCVNAFNNAITELTELNINPVVRELADDYLPINFNCTKDNSRFRLRHEQSGNDHFAVGKSRKGHEYRFYLGADQLSFDEIQQSGRWSPDVCLPVLFNSIVSGCVVGKSSALYGLVMNRVIENGLNQEPVPMLVPDLSKSAPPKPDSTLFQFLTHNCQQAAQVQ